MQVDITAVVRRSGDDLVAGYLCDHNCTITYRGRPTGGHYNCPAAFSLNRGPIATTAAPADKLRAGIERVVTAGRLEQSRFVREDFDRYAADFQLPAEVSGPLRQGVAADTSEVALFGGSPEAHPEIIELVSGLREAGHQVHVTMTGRKVMRSAALLPRLAAAGLNVVALSLDDVGSYEELRVLLDLDPDELHARWRRVPPAHGQRQKVYEAVYTARMLQRLPEPRPALLLNIAVHPGNLPTLDAFLGTLSQEMGPVALNPFPAQSAFEGRTAGLPAEYTAEFARFVEAVIEQQHRAARGEATRWSVVPRMHYWLALRAALDMAEPGEGISGWRTWRCFHSAGAGRYIQIAGTGQSVTEFGHAGGRVGCFWNETLAAPELPPVWDAEPHLLAEYLEQRPSRAAHAPDPCGGCLFPRLVADMVALETGLHPALRKKYLDQRSEHLGF